MDIIAESLSISPLSRALVCKLMICTVLRASVVNEYTDPLAFFNSIEALFRPLRAHLEQSLTACTQASIVCYALKLGGYDDVGAGSPPGAP